MGLQMIFCIETNKAADTDSVYISELLSFRYLLSNKIKITKIYMGSKTKYKSREVLKEIEKKTRDYSIGDTKVIYCIDTDDYETNSEHNTQLSDITHFCTERGYDLVWFCHDVEEVFWGTRVSDSEKVDYAGAFRRKRKIEELAMDKLTSTILRKNASNILLILDKFLERK